MSLRLVVDSSCELPIDMITKYNILVIPLILTINGKEYFDRVDISIKEFYKFIEDPNVKPTTTQVTPDRFMKIFKEIEEQVDEVLCITIGSNASGTCQSALIARDYLGSNNISVIDSNMLCMGTGYLVILAAGMIEEGRSRDEIVGTLQELTNNRIEHLFCVDTLEYLKRGGRIRASKAFAAKILGIKPVLNVKDALTQPIGKVRSRSKIIPYYLTHIANTIDLDNNKFIAVAHSNEHAFADEFIKAFKLKFDWDKPIYRSEIGPTIGVHAGPGVLAAFYLKR